MKRLEGRTAIVTGASRGIGPVIAEALAGEGVNLVLAARSADALQQEAARLTAAFPVRAIAVPTDVTDPAQRSRLLARAQDEFGAVDILVNNAGTAALGTVADQRPADLERTLQVDLAAPVALTRLLLPGMIARGEGHVVQVSTILAKVDTQYAATYAAAKAGLTHFSRSLRAELRGTGVGASSVSPGLVRATGMSQQWMDDANIQPPRLMGTVSAEQVARGVLRAITRDKAEVLVGPRGTKLLTLSPGFAARMFGRVGAWEMMRRLSEAGPAGPIVTADGEAKVA